MRKFKKSIGHALRGLKTAISQERNFRIQIICGIAALVLAGYLEFSWAEWMWTIVAIHMVLAAELINTALEYILDHLSPQQSKEAGLIKDVSAGMVLLQAIGAVVIGIMVLLHHFQAL